MNKTFAKTILVVYGSLAKTVSQIDRLVYRRALATHSSSGCGFCNTEKQIEDIVALINKKNKLINLKLLADEVFACLDKETRDLLYDKYIARLNRQTMAKKLNVSTRTYYRKLDRAETSFAKECLLRGVDDKTFKQDYFDQNWLKTVYAKLEENNPDSES